jgi:hypothetical protein
MRCRRDGVEMSARVELSTYPLMRPRRHPWRHGQGKGDATRFFLSRRINSRGVKRESGPESDSSRVPFFRLLFEDHLPVRMNHFELLAEERVESIDRRPWLIAVVVEKIVIED